MNRYQVLRFRFNKRNLPGHSDWQIPMLNGKLESYKSAIRNDPDFEDHTNRASSWIKGVLAL